MIHCRGNCSYLVCIVLLLYNADAIVVQVSDCDLSTHWTSHELVNVVRVSHGLLDELKSRPISERILHLHVVIQTKCSSIVVVSYCCSTYLIFRCALGIVLNSIRSCSSLSFYSLSLRSCSSASSFSRLSSSNYFLCYFCLAVSFLDSICEFEFKLNYNT